MLITGKEIMIIIPKKKLQKSGRISKNMDKVHSGKYLTPGRV